MRKKDLNTKRDSHDSRHTQDCSVGSGRITARYSSSPPNPRSDTQTAERPLGRRLIGAVAGIHPAFALLVALTVALIVPLAVQTAWAQDNGSIEYAEKGMDAVATYTATDPEMAGAIKWSLSGDDAGDFDIDDGVLTFSKSPDYEAAGDENTDNTYAVTVVATDADGMATNKEVTVEVTNVDEDGTVTLSALQPAPGVNFTATLTDIDNGSEDLTAGAAWQWSRSRSRTSGFADIEDAEASTYAPVDGDQGYYLMATARYTDDHSPIGADNDKTASMVSVETVVAPRTSNNPPEFSEDEDGMRTLVETADAETLVGDPVVAEDDDAQDVLTYTLDDDSDKFVIDRATGQISVASGAVFNHIDDDAVTGVDKPASYTVTVIATDPDWRAD